MHTEFPTRSSVSRLTAAALFAALAYLGAAPAMAQTPSLTITKSGGTFAGGGLANFTIVLTNPAPTGTGPVTGIQMVDPLPGAGVINWGIASQSLHFGCGMDGTFPAQQTIICDADSMYGGDVNTMTVVGQSPDTCLKLDNTATATYRHGEPVQGTARVTVTSATCLPAFVIGNNENHAAGAYVNFWGHSWWKNNSMTGPVSKGVASFKGWASNADIICGPGVTWATRPGNSSNPPATIPTDTDIMVIVTDTVLKDGPDITGNIIKILRVRSDGTYGPNPGHPGIGYVTEVVCPVAP